MLYAYDLRGRLETTKRRDDCNGSSSGDREEYTYSDDGLLTKVETFDASGTVTKRQELTYFDSRRLEKIINPVNTAKWTGLSYEDRGLLSEVAAKDGSNNLSKTAWTYDAQARVSEEQRYTTSSAFDTWSLLFDWLGNQTEVADDDGKTTTSKRDDLGRVVELGSPDLAASIVRVYDSGNRLVTVVDPHWSTNDHTFSYDTLNRQTEADYSGTCPNGTGGDVNVPDIVRVYDALPTGVSCPTGVGCAHLEGRLAYVKVKLMCADAAGTDSDWTLEQETFYSYDPAGRLVHEYLQDETGRTADHQYAWTKNGALAEVTMPSGAVIGWTYGSTSSNSDTDRITAIWRTSTSTPIIDTIQWMPYGPVQQYNQMNTISTNPEMTINTYNLAYRMTQTRVRAQTGSPTLHMVTLGEDAAGRVFKRDYYPNTPTGKYDSYFKYDLQDRVLCEQTTNAATCPTSGTNLKNNHSASPPFTAGGDWKQLLRPIPGSTGLTHDFTLVTGTHQLASVSQSDGTPTLGSTVFDYDSRGARSLDDNQSTLTHDARTYTYDDRGNVVNVRGEYYTGSAWHYYDVASAFDAKNRRVFKSFYDETTGDMAQWFFYYDALDRLTEVRHTPDISAPSTYTVFQLIWLGNRLVLYWQTDYPSATTSRRYVATDETGRPVDMICWNSGGANCPRVWTINSDAWGNDTVLMGASVYQPILFAGQYKDDETTAWQNDGTTPHRPGVVAAGPRTYDPWTGAALQTFESEHQVLSSYSQIPPIGTQAQERPAVSASIRKPITFPEPNVQTFETHVVDFWVPVRRCSFNSVINTNGQYAGSLEGFGGGPSSPSLPDNRSSQKGSLSVGQCFQTVELVPGEVLCAIPCNRDPDTINCRIASPGMYKDQLMPRPELSTAVAGYHTHELSEFTTIEFCRCGEVCPQPPQPPAPGGESPAREVP